jgi:putative ABC transport system ATP-binding protein
VTAQVKIESLVKNYGTLRALNGISFKIQAGEWIALMGPSGSGKTTLINILGGLDTLTSGHVIVDGVRLADLGENELVRYRAEKIGFVFQQFHLVPYLNALENVMLAQYFHSVTDEAQAAEALKRVGLSHRLTHLPSQLSGGEQQRVAIARALTNNPDIIFADEPTGNLDSKTGDAIMDLLLNLARDRKKTLLVVTHDSRLAARGDRQLHIKDGVLQQA